MKIGMFTDTYEPKIDGIVSSIKAYAAELKRRGHTVKIYSPKNSLFAKEEAVSADNTRIPSLSYYAYPDFRLSLPYDPRLVHKIRKERFDVIHTHTPGSIGLLGIGAARLFGIPAVHTYHTHLEEYVHYFPAPETLSKYGVKKFVSAYINRHHAAIAPSRAIQALLKEYGVEIPTHVLPSGIDLPGFAHLKTPHTAYPYIITMSRIGKEKNLDFLVHVFTVLAQRHSDLHFIIAGGGPYEKELAAIVQKSAAADRIHLMGFMRHKELFPLVAGARTFLSASKTETQGLTTVEALACGTPVVAVKASGVEDTLAGDVGGYLVPEDIELFVEKVSALLTDNSLYAQKKHEALGRAHDFSVEACTDRLLGIYNECHS